MLRQGNAQIPETESGIIRQEMLLARQDAAATPVFAGMSDERPHELPGIPFAPVFRQYVQPEHALPFPVFLVEFGLLEHDVGNGTVIRHHAVYKADESPLILQQKEMTGKNLEPGGKRFPCACLARGKTDCFDPANSIQIILCSRPYPHELHLASIYS